MPPQASIPRGVWMLGFVSLLMDVSSEMIHALLPLYLTVGLGASALVVGVIEGVAEATTLVVKVFSGTLSDRLGKRQAIAAAGYGLRQSLDTVGALAGPLAAMALMLAWNDDFRAVFWVAVVPALLSFALIAFAVRDPGATRSARTKRPFSWKLAHGLGRRFWIVTAVGSALTLARFSEAFLVLMPLARS